ncbi:MAG: 2-oxo-4-hydroxy-4-carboxy-5-ureidoimidazoline decarboxylase [Zoogloeaceae bacterium]|nr:2-oxo-4-hydroxy-4-carboxy-5-ureidoimidazoline decarboxylase [Zoogloeaceae bacterium]
MTQHSDAGTATRGAKLAHLSMLDQAAFVAQLGHLFEHSPWVAERAWASRPFPSLEGLHGALVAAMYAADEASQLSLLRAHPELGARAVQSGTLTAASRGEQRGAGLASCTDEEGERLGTLNRAYCEKFGFPFIIAVKGLGPAEILQALETRLCHGRAEEFEAAMAQVARIAYFRLEALL